MSVPKFADLVKSVSDVFSDDYKTKNLLKIKHVTPNNVTVTSEAELDAAFSAIVGNASLKYKHSSGFSLDKLAVKPGKGGKVTFSAETSLEGVAPGLKFTFKGDDSSEGKLGAEYATDIMSLTGELDVNRLSAFDLSASTSMNNVVLGGALSYDLTGKTGAYESLKTLDLGASFSNKDFFVGVTTQDKFKGVKVSGLTRALPNVTLATEVGLKGSDISANVGTIYNCHSSTALRFKISKNGEVAGSVSYTPVKKCNVVVAAAFDSKTSNIKHGVNVTLG